MVQELNELELSTLRQSPYVEHVTPKKIIYGAVFEREYHRLIQTGYSMLESFEFLGLDPEILGRDRMKAYHHRYQSRLANDLIAIPIENGKPLTISQELEEKNHRIKMLEQELEFLKKKMQLTHQYKQPKDSNNTTSD